MKVKIAKINVYARKLFGKGGGICPTAEMVRKLNAPPKNYVEVESLLDYMRWTNNKFNQDNFHEKEAVDDFINILHGVLKEHCSPEEIEWE